MPVEELAELARDIFGDDRVQVAERLDDAIDLAVLAEWPTPTPPTGRPAHRRAGHRLGRHRGRRAAAARPGASGGAERQSRIVWHPCPLVRRRALMKRLCGTVLGMEAVIALLAIVPAKVLGHASGGTAAAVCGTIAIVALVLAGSWDGGRGRCTRARRSSSPSSRPACCLGDVHPGGDLHRALVHRHLAGQEVGEGTRADAVKHHRLSAGSARAHTKAHTRYTPRQTPRRHQADRTPR